MNVLPSLEKSGINCRNAYLRGSVLIRKEVVVKRQHRSIATAAHLGVLLLTLMVGATVSLPAMAQEVHPMYSTAAVKCVPNGEKRPGYYGYRHCELHYSGAIAELMRKTHSRCCDGAGECRVTTIWRDPKTLALFASLNGRACPIAKPDQIVGLSTLPLSAYAMVCASQVPDGQCPTQWCVGMQEGAS